MIRAFKLGCASALALLLQVAHADTPLSVTVNEPLPDAKEGNHYITTINVNNDDSNEPLTFSLIEGPPGLRVSPGGRVTWVPDYDATGNRSITVRVSTERASTRLELPFYVENTNRPPEFTSHPREIMAEGETFRYPINAVDPDDDPVTLTVEQRPQGMELQDNTLIWHTSYDDAGVYPVRIAATDSDLTTYQSFNLVVHNTNRPPVFGEVNPDKLQLRENQRWKLELDVSDPDGDDLALELINAPDGMELHDKTIEWRPTFEQSGSYYVTVKADDGEDTATLPLSIEVADVNRFPNFITRPETSIEETESFYYEVRAFDPDNDPLQFQLEQGPEGMTLRGSVVSWQTGYDDAGKYPVTLSVSDGQASVEQSFTLEVIDKNRPPYFRSSPLTRIRETEKFVYEIEAVDPDGGPVNIELLELPEQIQRDGNTLYWQTDHASTGTYLIHIRATDDDGDYIDQEFVLRVENLNRPPVITSEPQLQTQEAFSYEYKIEAYDEDGDELSYTLEESPRGMRIDGPKITWRPSFDQAGQHEVVIAVSDGIDTVTQDFVIEVDRTNREPVLVSIDDQSVVIGETFTYQVEASDPDGDEVTVSLVNQPQGMTVDRNHRISWTPGENDIGIHPILVNASDGDLRVREHFELEVKPAPPPEEDR